MLSGPAPSSLLGAKEVWLHYPTCLPRPRSQNGPTSHTNSPLRKKFRVSPLDGTPLLEQTATLKDICDGSFKGSSARSIDPRRANPTDYANVTVTASAGRLLVTILQTQQLNN